MSLHAGVFEGGKSRLLDQIVRQVRTRARARRPRNSPSSRSASMRLGVSMMAGPMPSSHGGLAGLGESGSAFCRKATAGRGDYGLSDPRAWPLQTSLQTDIGAAVSDYSINTSDSHPAASGAAGHRFESCRAYQSNVGSWQELATPGSSWRKEQRGCQERVEPRGLPGDASSRQQAPVVAATLAARVADGTCHPRTPRPDDDFRDDNG